MVDKLGMTQPRIILRGEVVFATRRCSERRFFLRPDRTTRQIVAYALAVASTRYGIQLHEFLVMSNHYHIVMSDPRGRRPDFFRDLNQIIARAVNAAFGRWEQFFAPGSYNAPKLLAGSDIADKAAYTLLNPVEAGLVRRPAKWIGVSSWSMNYGESRTIARPKVFFSERMPATATLTLTRPTTMYPGLDDAAARELLRARVTEQARETVRRIRKEGGKFMGMGRVMRQPRDSSPFTRAPRRGIKPTVAGRNPHAREEALQYREGFLSEYRQALKAWLAGARRTLFPAGTYLMMTRFNVRVAKL